MPGLVEKDEAVDYIVVGAGPAGCAVAVRLARSPERPTVALFDTGPAKASALSDMPLGIAALVPRRSKHNYAYETVPQAGFGGRRGFQPRGRGIGGSSLINAMIYIRGQPEDYDGWAAQGCHGWGWADVLPYFKRSESNARGADALHGGDGPLHVCDLSDPSPVSRAFVEACVAAGYTENPDFNGPHQEGVGQYQVFQKDGRRFNAGRAYLQSGGPLPNLRVVADSAVTRITFAGRRATGIAYRGPDGEGTLTARREVIVSAGAFGSPQLLMLSGVGPGAELAKFGIPVVHAAEGVGANLQDHCDYSASVKANAAGLLGLTLPMLARGAAALVGYHRHGRGQLTTNIAESGGFLRSAPEVARPDLQLHFCIGLVDDHNRKVHLGTGMSLHVCVLRPKSRGSVRLGGPCVTDEALIDPAFLSHPDDLALLVRGAGIVQHILAQPALARMEGRWLYGTGHDGPDELERLMRARADSIYHPVGTCRMGADAASVVDPELRVRGVDGLRVIDASIMPDIISGNTQGPSSMIGEKGADLILGNHARAA